MAMDISSNYGGYSLNTMAAAGKESGQSSGIEKDVSKNSKENVQEYYENLCKKFPRISFNSKGGIRSSSENKIVLNLSEDCLKKMAADPDFAKEIENTISGIPTAHNWVYAKAKSDGIELHGLAVRINADGSVQCSCEGSSTRTGVAGQSRRVTSLKKQKNERMEKGQRAEKKSKERAEKTAKKRAEKGAEEDTIESLLWDYSEIVEASLPGFDFKA